MSIRGHLGLAEWNSLLGLVDVCSNFCLESVRQQLSFRYSQPRYDLVCSSKTEIVITENRVRNQGKKLTIVLSLHQSKAPEIELYL
jgi:hypothetical protein